MFHFLFSQHFTSSALNQSPLCILLYAAVVGRWTGLAGLSLTDLYRLGFQNAQNVGVMHSSHIEVVFFPPILSFWNVAFNAFGNFIGICNDLPAGLDAVSSVETASLAYWLWCPPQEQKIPCSNPACAGIFLGSSHTNDLKIGTPVATLPGAWHYRISAGTSWPGVSIL